MWPAVLKFLTSRTGLFCLLVLVLFAWHSLDKGSAVRSAVTGYIADVELAAAEAELQQAKRMAKAAQNANRALQAALAVAEAQKAASDRELENYVSKVGADCAVDGVLLERLQHR